MAKKERSAGNGKVKERIIPSKIKEIKKEESELEKEIENAEAEELSEFKEDISSVSDIPLPFSQPVEISSQNISALEPRVQTNQRREEQENFSESVRYVQAENTSQSREEEIERFYREQRGRVVSQSPSAGEQIARRTFQGRQDFSGNDLERAPVQREIREREDKYSYKSETIGSTGRKRRSDEM